MMTMTIMTMMNVGLCAHGKAMLQVDQHKQKVKRFCFIHTSHMHYGTRARFHQTSGYMFRFFRSNSDPLLVNQFC